MKETWLNVNGTWKKAINVWLNVDGVWKNKVIPKGYVGDVLKEFKTYNNNPSNPPVEGLLNIVEDFSEDTIKFPYVQGLQYPWIFDKGASPTGDIGYLRTSNPSIPDSESIITFQIDVPVFDAASLISILEVKYAISSEEKWDVLNIYLNDTLIKTDSSTNLKIDTLGIPLSTGTHYIKFSYTKDGSSNIGTDSAYIDKITLYQKEKGQFIVHDDFNGNKSAYTWYQPQYALWEESGGKLVNVSNKSFYTVTQAYINAGVFNQIFYEIDYDTNTDGTICYRMISGSEGFHVSGDQLYLQTSISARTAIGTLSIPLGSSGKFRVELRGNEHKIFINDNLSLTVNRTEYSKNGTGFGLGTTARSNVSTTRFDNLKIGNLS